MIQGGNIGVRLFGPCACIGPALLLGGVYGIKVGGVGESGGESGGGVQTDPGRGDPGSAPKGQFFSFWHSEPKIFVFLTNFCPKWHFGPFWVKKNILLAFVPDRKLVTQTTKPFDPPLDRRGGGGPTHPSTYFYIKACPP